MNEVRFPSVLTVILKFRLDLLSIGLSPALTQCLDRDPDFKTLVVELEVEFGY